MRHESYAEAHKQLVADELDVQSVLTAAKEEHRKQLDDGNWPAAAHAKDSKAINRSYGNVSKAEMRAVNLLANALEQVNQGGGGRDKSNDKCNNCGKLGHWANDCPEGNRKNRGGNGGRAPFNSPLRKGNKSSQSKSGQDRKPQFPPPKEGESEIKTVNNKKLYWCAKCCH